MGDHVKIFARSFSGLDQKKLVCGAFVGCFVVAVNLCTVLKPFLGLPPIYFHVESVKPIIRNFSNARSDVYEINGDVRIHGISSTIFIASTKDKNLSSWTIKPHPRKIDPIAMKTVTDFKIKAEEADRIPRCNRNLSIPAILFSTGGHAGNHFHALADVLIPLFWTSHHFNGTIIFLVTNRYWTYWTFKYRFILEKLSKYDVYDIDKENEVLCFSRMIVGLKGYKDMEIDPSESTHVSVRNFTNLLQLGRESVHDRHQTGRVSQPRILIISRQESRKLINDHEVGDMARGLGFDVVVEDMSWNASLVAQRVNSFDVLVGVHGAGLANMVFLPESAVLIQIVPFGCDHVAKVCYESAAERMKLRYLTYRVSLNESSLLGKYPPDSEVYRDPEAIRERGFVGFKNVYLDKQDVTLDLDRFRKTLLRAFELVAA